MASNVKVSLDFSKINPKQEKFMRADKKHIGFGGARGGGKSWVVRMKSVLLALNYPGIRVLIVRRTYPELKANENYQKTMDSVNAYEEMVRKSRLVYNDSVTKLNRTIRMFPTSIAASILGIKSRDYLEADDKKADMPSMR